MSEKTTMRAWRLRERSVDLLDRIHAKVNGERGKYKAPITKTRIVERGIDLVAKEEEIDGKA